MSQMVMGSRPSWLRVLLVPSQPFRQVMNPARGTQITDPVFLRFEAAPIAGVPQERVIQGTPSPDGRIIFSASAEQVNDIIQACGALSRDVRMTISDLTWGAGSFEIDGTW